MIIVNPHFISRLLDPIGGDDEEIYELYKDKEIKTKEQFKEVIREKILKYYEGFSDKKKIKTKTALSYYLSKDNYDKYKDIYESNDIPFDPPENARDFFVWIWEELFAKEDYHIADMKQYQVVVDIHEPNLP